MGLRVWAEHRRFLVGVATGILLATALRALLSTLFYLSLVTLRLNGTAFWSLVLLAPLAALALPRTRWPLLAAGAAVALLPFARFTGWYVPVAALAAAAALLALAQRDRMGMAGAVAGLLLGGASLLVDASHDPLLFPWAAPVALGLGLLAFLDAGGRVERPSAGAGVAWGCLLALEIAFLAAPYTVARHVDLPAWTAALAGLGGFALGLLALRRAPRVLVLLLGALALADLAALRGPLAPVSLAALHASLGALAARLPRPHALPLALALGGPLFGLLYFGQTLGPREWGLAMPALALGALSGLLLRAPPLAVPWRSAAVALAAGLLALPAALAAPDAPPQDDGVLTVLDWNVHQGFGNRGALDPAVYADTLARLRPDVVVLQEADTARLSSGGLDVVAYLARATGLQPATQGGSVVILSRFPIAEDWTAPPPEGWRAQVALDVEGRVVHVQGVHLARSAAERAAQSDELLRTADRTEGPLVLAGDINSCPARTCFGGRPSDNLHAKLGTAYQDTWSARHAPDDPAGNTHPTPSPRRRIDVVMVRGLDVLEAGPVRDDLTALGSDHLPVLARLAFPGP